MSLPMRLERGYPGQNQREWSSMLSRLFGAPLWREEDGEGAGLLSSRFDVDIREDEDHIFIEADLPGFRKEDVHLTLENGMLTIIAERTEGARGDERGEEENGGRESRGGERGKRARGRQAQGERSGDYLLRERRMQRVVRSFTLPPNVDEQNVRARLEDGVLAIELDKRAETKSRRIEVT